MWNSLRLRSQNRMGGSGGSGGAESGKSVFHPLAVLGNKERYPYFETIWLIYFSIVNWILYKRPKVAVEYPQFWLYWLLALKNSLVLSFLSVLVTEVTIFAMVIFICLLQLLFFLLLLWSDRKCFGISLLVVVGEMFTFLLWVFKLVKHLFYCKVGIGFWTWE